MRLEYAFFDFDGTGAAWERLLFADDVKEEA